MFSDTDPNAFQIEETWLNHASLLETAHLVNQKCQSAHETEFDLYVWAACTTWILSGKQSIREFLSSFLFSYLHIIQHSFSSLPPACFLHLFPFLGKAVDSRPATFICISPTSSNMSFLLFFFFCASFFGTTWIESKEHLKVFSVDIMGDSTIGWVVVVSLMVGFGAQVSHLETEERPTRWSLQVTRSEPSPFCDDYIRCMEQLEIKQHECLALDKNIRLRSSDSCSRQKWDKKLELNALHMRYVWVFWNSYHLKCSDEQKLHEIVFRKIIGMHC